MKILFFDDELEITISDKDWEYLCEYRWFTDDPEFEDIEAEFVSGTGITQNKRHLWPKASERFASYVQELREILFGITDDPDFTRVTPEEKARLEKADQEMREGIFFTEAQIWGL